MSTWSDGAKSEKLLCKMLEELGFITRRFPHSRFNKQDVWGCDIIAKNTDGKTLWIQVKSRKDSMPGIEKKVMQDMDELWRNSNGEYETLLWAGYNRLTKEWKFAEIVDPMLGQYKCLKDLCGLY